LAKRPGIDWSVMRKAGEYIIANKTNYNFNPANWGFADETFEEYRYN
jgi:hypothetical protein